MVVRGWVAAGFVVAAVGAGAGCVKGSKKLSSEDREKVKAFVLDSAPADIAHKTDINFENRIHLIGYRFEPEVVKPGTEVKLTYYWRCDDPVDEGWMLFTHLHDEASNRSDNLDWNGVLREQRGNKQLFGPERWQKGKVYVDEQTYRVPDWVTGPELTVYTGVWKGDTRLRIVTGPNDGENRGIVGKLKTGLTPPAEPAPTKGDVPELRVTKLTPSEKIVVDGKGDDAAWAGAASTGPFVDVGSGKPNPGSPVNGSAKLLWDDQNLYVLFEVVSPNVVGGFESADKQKDWFTAAGQPKLWTRDTVEIMVDPDGDGDNKNYYELQINPQNKVFHSQFDAYNAPRVEPNGPYGHEDWDPKLKSAVVVKGTLDKSDDQDQGYSVEIAIPWAAFTKAEHRPPKPSSSWRMNFYAMKDNGGTAWSPILGQGNFHKASRFGRVVWTAEHVAGAPAALKKGPEGRK